jgi:hypothetical protein
MRLINIFRTKLFREKKLPLLAIAAMAMLATAVFSEIVNAQTFVANTSDSPDAGGTPGTLASTAPPLPLASPTCTPSGGVNVINDGGFENGGIPSTIWNHPQSSTNFGTPICDVGSCGTANGAAPPRTGAIWAWFGGIDAVETAALGQDVVIPTGSATLHFWMRVGQVSSPFTDVFNVKVDNVIVQSYPEPSAPEADYTERIIDLTQFANGASHNITFEYNGPTTGIGSYVVDDVSLIAGPVACSTPTATNTATPSPTQPPPIFANSAAICTTLGAPADLYPSTVTVAGGPNPIGDVRITFNNFWHQFPDNFDALLVGPGGQKYVLQGDAGGAIAIPQNAPVTLTFADPPVTAILPDSGPLTTGVFLPTTWASPVTSFVAPAPPAPYVEPGTNPNRPVNLQLRGQFRFTNANGVWSLYIRDDGGASTQQAITGCLDGGWSITFLPLTAAQASISGRVTMANGNGIRNAKIVVTGNSISEPVVVSTGSFGYYAVDGLRSGETYVVTVNSKRYTFSDPTRVISLVNNVVDADFAADPQG